MVKFWLRLDARFRGAHERIAHRVQWLTGRTSFWLASQCLLLYLGLQTFNVLDYWVQALLTKVSQLVDVILTGPVVLIYYHVAQRLRQAEEDFQARPHLLPTILLMYDNTVIRILLTVSFTVVILLAPLGTKNHLFDWMNEVQHWVLLSGIYFSTVRPLPPAPGKVQLWLASFRPAPVPTKESA